MVKSDIIFVLDASGSVGASNFREVVEFTRNFINELEIGPNNTQVGVVVYASSATTIFNLNTHSNKADLLAATNTIMFTNGATNTADGLCLMLEGFNEENGARLSQSDVFRLGIFMTDGRSNRNTNRCPPPGTTSSVAQLVHNSSDPITVFSIGVTNNVNQNELRLIASEDDFTVNIASFDNQLFREISDQQMEELCTRGRCIIIITISKCSITIQTFTL